VADLIREPNRLHTALGGYDTRYPDLVRFVKPYCDSPRAPVREQARRFVARHTRPRPAPKRDRGNDAGRGMDWVHEKLGDGGIAMEVHGLLSFMGDRADSVRVFEILLHGGAAGCDATVLESLAGLPDEILSTWRYFDHVFGDLDGITTVDTTALKGLAMTEQARRETMKKEPS